MRSPACVTPAIPGTPGTNALPFQTGRTPLPTHRRDANAWAILYLYDLQGRELWKVQQEKGAWAIATMTARWNGPDAPQHIFVYGQGGTRPAVLYDGNGKIAEEFPMHYESYRTEADRRMDFYGLAADVWGDERDEILLFNPRGACIYVSARPLDHPGLYNETFYPGM